ncbi:tetratricopeptide repeat-containing sulfotransferase family protein [Caulobacter sp. KR2-114]|uniref:tetratricopeptide repeat-containing sulfotransferase family protein n=1 Tax=Caulobacter sp. KR2-114 TaxID=3400912 RepID=UPI003BFAAE93
MQALAKSPTELEVGRLRQLQQGGRHAEALAGALALKASVPQNRDVLLLAATSQRCLGQVDAAMQTLDELEQVAPRFSRLHQERGMGFVARRDAPNAIRSLLIAVNINPALPASWNMLAGLYRMTGDAQNEALAEAHVETLKVLAPEVVAATSHFSDGDVGLAEQIIRPYLRRHGDDPEGMRLLARIGIELDVLNDAEALLEGVLARLPTYHAARYDYAQTLIRRQKHAEARAEAQTLLAQDPANPDYLTLAATAEVGLGQNARALAIYERMLQLQPSSWDVPLWMGHAYKTIGQIPEAIAAYRAAAAARPDFGDAYWSLANLKTYRFTDEELARMRAGEAAPSTALTDRLHLCFALGKALEDRGEPEASWAFYSRGNALKRAESRYAPEIIEDNTARQKQVCTRAFFADRAGWGDPRPDPIFVLGLPRSGSTLIEQILASHSQVEGTLELSNVQRIVLDLQGPEPEGSQPRYPHALGQLSPDAVRALGARYLEETRAYRTDRPFFIDKMPNNFRHIGLIALMLPNARIIDARRDPMSCCFSNLKQLYAQGQEFTYSVDDIARYYRTYLELMRHWDEALPGRILRVQHEDVVDDLEGSVRRILDHCALPFEPGCVDFHKTRRAVRTPSAEQVRQPIFRDGLDQWTRYEPWLDDLKAALGDALVRYRD